jgi:DNA-binding FrmR family transcriptional regulator
MRDDYRYQILNRWKTIEGHTGAVRRMIEQDQYCVDILKQTLAIQGAIDRVNALLLENHMKTCVTTAIRSDVQAERERVIGELLQLFQGGSNVAWNRGISGTETIGADVPASEGISAAAPDRLCCG